MKICVFDVEANGLTPTKLWCLTAAVYSEGGWRLKTTTSYEDMRKFFSGCDIVVGHNITRWDIPNVERLLEIKIEAKVIDTLALSWYLYPNKLRHGLDDWGVEFGIPKPKIGKDEWVGALPNETYEEFLAKMSHRCEEDVKINCKLWDKQWKDLTNLYDEDESEVWRFIDYIEFKMDCAAEAERSGWRLDIDRCTRVLGELELEKSEKVEEIKSVMPDVIKKSFMERPETLYLKGKTHKRPKTLHKKDGSLSSAGEKFVNLCTSLGLDPDREDEVYVESSTLTAKAIKWVELLEATGLPEDHTEPVEYVVSVKEPNPNSSDQIKDWLYSYGWKPETFDIKREKDENGRLKTRKVPQVRMEVKGTKTLCYSVKDLFEKEPKIEVLEGLTVISHRISILNGFLKNVDENGYIMAQVQGLTNTLRFKHKTIVNLPSVAKAYGEDIRGALIAPEGYELCGSDMSSLEDRTKQHYMWKHDPEYVKEMMTPDFDPHLDLAVVAGFITEEQSQDHKKGIKKCSGERGKAKTANYACVYGAVGATVARGAGMSKAEGEALVDKYWQRNWSVKAIAKEQTTKQCIGGTWLFNPVSKFWYSLRYDKDRFSTLNQGTGVYCFDIWIKNFRELRPQLTGQMHDEVILCIKKGHREGAEKLLRDAIVKTNEQLKLNRDLDIDVQFGDNYAQIH